MSGETSASHLKTDLSSEEEGDRNERKTKLLRLLKETNQPKC